MNMKKYIGLLFAMLVMVSCESLEDTYEDFAGNGPCPVLGKNVRTSPFNRDGTVCK